MIILFRQGGDLSELRRHAYSNTVERYCIKQLVGRVFPSCQCEQVKRKRCVYTCLCIIAINVLKIGFKKFYSYDRNLCNLLHGCNNNVLCVPAASSLLAIDI